MANYNTLKTSIEDVIKQNGNNEITGTLLQQTLLAMVNSLGVGYQYVGIATPDTNPGTPDQNVFYLASTAGTYTNFGGLILADGEIAILKWNGAWSKDSTGAASSENSVFDQSTILQKRASYYKQYDCIVGKKYLFENIGDALVNVYYSTTGDVSGEGLIKQLAVGESYVYVPEINSGYIYNSTSDIRITEYGRVSELEQEVTPLVNDINGIKGELATNKDLFTKLTKDGENKGNWLNGVYLNSSKAYAGSSAWRVGIFTISEKVKYLILDIDCTGSATYSFLEDGNGNTLKSWHTEMIKEVISIADYPTAATLRVSYKSEYDGGIVLLEDGELERTVYDLLYKDAPGQWQDGFYNSEKALSANSNWEAFHFWFNNQDVKKIRVIADCSSTTAFCYLLDESWNILKSWNSANFIETITLADYPSARLLLVSNRKSNTSRAVKVWYEQNVAELNSKLNNEVTNYKMRSIVPVKIKSTDNVLFVGDSITYGQGAGSSSNRWVDRVCAAIGCSFVNDSEAGAAFAEGRIISHINDKDLTQFSYIVIAAGINDCNRGYTKTQIQNAVGAICDYINAYTGFTGKVLFVTPANEYRPKDTRAIYSVEQVRRIIYDKVASYGNFYLLDGGGIPFSNIIGDATNALLVTYQSDGVTFDGLHPNANGHLMYANYFLTNCANL